MVFKWKTNETFCVTRVVALWQIKDYVRKMQSSDPIPSSPTNGLPFSHPTASVYSFLKYESGFTEKIMLFLLDMVTVSIPSLYTRKRRQSFLHSLLSFFIFFPTKNAFNLEKLLGKRKCSMSVVPYFFLFFLDSVGWKVK